MREGDFAGPYRLVRRLGRGGMGEVWEARRKDGRGAPVALKLLDDEDAGAPAKRIRFADEARLSLGLLHPHIVHALEVSEKPPYLALELLEGLTLSAVLARNPRGLPWELVGTLACQALSALAYVRSLTSPDGSPLRLVHRDLKPSNLFLTSRGQLKVIDFGIARAVSVDSTETRTGTMLGSLGYASPEQARGEALDSRTDLFSLGLVLHELCTGKRVFAHESSAAIVSALLFSPIPPLRSSHPDIPLAFEHAVARLTEKDLGARAPTADEALASFEAAVPKDARWSEERIGSFVRESLERAPMTAPQATAIPGTTKRMREPSRDIESVVEPIRARSRWPWLLGLGALAVSLGFVVANRPTPNEPVIATTPVSVPIAATPPSEPVTLPDSVPAPVVPIEVPPEPRKTRPKSASPAAQGSGWLSVDVREGWATVFVDGKELGVTPLFRQSLSAGKRRLEARFTDGKRLRRTVTIDSDKETKVVLQ